MIKRQETDVMKSRDPGLRHRVRNSHHIPLPYRALGIVSSASAMASSSGSARHSAQAAAKAAWAECRAHGLQRLVMDGPLFRPQRYAEGLS
jgi:hypothetical protein